MKKEVRVIGFDDGPSRSDVLVVGTVYRGKKSIDGILSTKIKKDGSDATAKLIELMNKTRFQPRCIMLDGIAFGGFNIVDVELLSKKTKLPVITVMRDLPDIDAIEKALSNLPNSKERLELIKKAGTIHSVRDIFVQVVGTDIVQATEFLKATTLDSNIPEPLRVSHLIASGIIKGESN